ncbi:MAG: hypothetical protein ABI047_10040 [Jatrophihabitantaceae bacterium]
MPEPLVCEDSDLQRLLDTVHSQPGAEILYQDRIRRGGVFGFFAREVHRVAYHVPARADTVTGEVASDAGLAVSNEPAGGLPELGDLLASVEAVEALEALSADQHRAAGPAVPQQQASPQQASPQHDFADLLRSLTDADLIDSDLTDSRPADGEPAGSTASPAAEQLSAPPARPPRPASAKPASRSNVTAFGRPDARARLEVLMQLRQVGVPVSVNPRTDTHSLYEALESILEELPAPAMPPRGAGQVLAVVGESGPALEAAHTCAAMLRIPRNSIGVAGLPEHASAEEDYPWISGQQEALRLRTELSRTDLPSIVVIATDATEAGSDDPWAAEMLAALRPTAVWAVVDARWKTEDSRAQLDRLGQVDALVVHSAQLSASPASVWDLDLPLGLLDGRAANTFAWTGLLFRLLRGEARHRASA